MKTLRFGRLILVLAMVGPAHAALDPIHALKQQEPGLYRLFLESNEYAKQLVGYANQQGFRQPFENLGTAVHEMIHIASAIHAGFFIDGVYYEPYLRSNAWPGLKNSDVGNFLLPEERSLISSVYLPNTPKNNLGNVLDEINAYSHVTGFICRNEPASAGKQVHNLTGHMFLLEAYLRAARTRLPEDYLKLGASRESRGAIETLYTRAVDALKACGVPESRIPGRETKHFLGLGRRTK